MPQVDIGTPVSGYDFSAQPSPNPAGFEYLGNQYVFLSQGNENSGGGATMHLRCFKSTDGGTTWVEKDSAGAPNIQDITNFGNAFTICRDGATVYALYVRAHTAAFPVNAVIDGFTVIQFDLGADTWGLSTDYAAPVLDFMQINAALPAGLATAIQVNLALRGPGDMVFFYSGPVEAVVGRTGKARMYYATFDGTTFGVGVELPGQSVSSSVFKPNGHTVDSSTGVTHFLGLFGNSVYHVAMDSGGGFGAPETVTAAIYLSNATLGQVTSPLVFASSGNRYLSFVALVDDGATQSNRFFFAQTVAGTGALAWFNSVISSGVYGTDPEVIDLNPRGGSKTAQAVAFSVQGSTVVVGWTFWDDPNFLGYFYYSQADFPTLAWSGVAIVITTSLAFATPNQISSWPVTGAVAFVGSSIDPGFDYPGQGEVAQYNGVPVSSNPPSLDCGNPPDGEVGVAYTAQLQASDGTPPYTFAIVAGALPDGLSLDAATGIISGIPTTPGTFPYTAQVTDSAAQTAQVDCSITITELTISGNPPPGVIGVPYTTTLTATGGTPPYSFSIISGSLPGCLALDGSTGEISGTPCSAGTFSFTAEVTDSLGATASDVFTIIISGPAGQQVTVAGHVPNPVRPKNAWDHCLECVRIYQRLICKRICPKPRPMISWPWDESEGIPPDAVPFRQTGGILTPFPVDGDVDILQFQVPVGYDAVLMQGYNLYLGTGFVQGSGDILWRLKINSYYAMDWGSVAFSLGSVRDPFPFSDCIFLTSRQLVTLQVNVPNPSGMIQVGASRIIGGLMGFYLPR